MSHSYKNSGALSVRCCAIISMLESDREIYSPTGLERRGRPVQGWKAFVAVPSMEWRFCRFFQLLHDFNGEGLC